MSKEKNKDPNKSVFLMNSGFNKKNIFIVSAANNNKSSLESNNLFNKSTSNITSANTNSTAGQSAHKLNQTCNLSFNCSKKKGRKKFLFDGFKTEIYDKAFIREFKNYLKKSKSLLRGIFEELKTEEKIFWNEFLSNNNPPFIFTPNGNKIEFKSFSKGLLRFIFSYPSVRNLYSLFVKEKEKEIIASIINKKIKKVEIKMLPYYSFYGKNLHKLYSNEFNINDINFEEFDNLVPTTSIPNNISDSITINTSI